jgi:hypothetical protein
MLNGFVVIGTFIINLINNMDASMAIITTEPAAQNPQKIYRIMDSKVDAIAAIVSVLAIAKTSIAIFDVSPITMREREYARPANIELMRQLLIGNPSRRIRIVLHETAGIEGEVPRLMSLLGDFSTQLSIQRTIGDARNAQDVMLIADDIAIWRKPVATHPRSILNMHDAADIEPFITRFEEIWELTERAVSFRSTGL